MFNPPPPLSHLRAALLHFQTCATPSPLSVAFRYIPVNTDHSSVFVNRVNKQVGLLRFSQVEVTVSLTSERQLLLDLSEHAVPLGLDVTFVKTPGQPNSTLFLHLNALQFAWESTADAKYVHLSVIVLS